MIAQNQPRLSSYLKAGFQGGTGTGKSTTAALLLLALSVTKHDRAPVLVRDSEPGWHFFKPLYDAEKVPLIIVPGRDFKGNHDALRRAVREGCCGFCTDSITHPWGELLERFADSTGRVPFHKFNQIKPLWNDWIVDFMDAPLHAIANGRLTWEYVTVETEDEKSGKKSYEMVKGDTKMKAGGSESFGYEPHLTCELTRHQDRSKGGRLRKVQYVCLVLKDRARALNGSELIFDDIGPKYQPGGFASVLQGFLPHIAALEQVSGVRLGKATSAELVPGGESNYYREQKQKTAALEDWDATVALLWPGQSAADKRARAVVGEAITGVRSRTKFEEMNLGQIEQCVYILMALEERLKKEPVSSDADLLALLEIAKEDYRAQETQRRGTGAGLSAADRELLSASQARNAEKVGPKALGAATTGDSAAPALPSPLAACSASPDKTNQPELQAEPF